MELTLKELIAFLPNELEPLYRLARLQEDQGLVDAAESTLLSGRHLRPDEVEPYKRLAQFYARRSTAMYWAKQKDKPPESLSSPGQPDAKGVYRVGGGLEPPRREGVAQYPKEAQNAGIQGAVVAEIVINEAGLVTDARVLRSIPFLDEAALEAVRKWRFEPTIVNGRAVPVTMEVTVNFRP
jgi:TonB family protein